MHYVVNVAQHYQGEKRAPLPGSGSLKLKTKMDPITPIFFATCIPKTSSWFCLLVTDHS